MRRIRAWRWDLSDFRFRISECGSRRESDFQSAVRNQHSAMKKRAKTYTISAVAEQFELHPQTLRLYEREGLLKPSRSEGNTRLYTDTDLERLEIILSLTRDLGVNLAGVEVILNMRQRLEDMHREMQEFIEDRKSVV